MFNDDPVIRAMQIGLGLSALLLVYLVFYATRDILQRSNSLLVQTFCIVMVALLPVVGFFLYLLVRPSETLQQRETATKIAELHTLLTERQEKLARVKSKAR